MEKKVNVTKMQVINNFGHPYHFTQSMKDYADPILTHSFPSPETVIQIFSFTSLMNTFCH